MAAIEQRGPSRSKEARIPGAIIEKRGNRFRVRVRIRGILDTSETFGDVGSARDWAERQVKNADQIRATGVTAVSRSDTIGDLIDRYVAEFETKKQWGRSKAADLARLRKDLGAESLRTLTTPRIVDYFRKRAAGDPQRDIAPAGPVVISGQCGYLITVMKTARSLWHMDVPLAVVEDARKALGANDLAGKSKERTRKVNSGRVLDTEIRQLVNYFNGRADVSVIPMADIVQFAVASAMRLSEIMRITWSDLDTKAATVIIRDRKDPRRKDGNDQIVPLLPEAVRIVKRQPRTEGEDRIFPFDHHSVGTLFGRAVKACRMVDLRFHDLRHEGISRLFDAGLDIPRVSIISGHKSWQMLRRYTKLGAADVHAALRRAKKRSTRSAA